VEVIWRSLISVTSSMSKPDMPLALAIRRVRSCQSRGKSEVSAGDAGALFVADTQAIVLLLLVHTRPEHH
jgi:hypothetical protein